MSSLIKKIFGALIEKPWEENQVKIDNTNQGKTFKGISPQVSAVIIIFGVSTVLFSLIILVTSIAFLVIKIHYFFLKQIYFG